VPDELQEGRRDALAVPLSEQHELQVGAILGDVDVP
jgi:hypothetical protein